MRVLQIAAPGKPELIEAAVPQPQFGQVLVNIEAVTTCPHWDLHILGGKPMFPGMQLQYPYWPGQPGHEAVGHIAAIGKGIQEFAVGDRVAVWRDAGPNCNGAYGQYALFDAENLISVPSHLDVTEIASLELAMCVQVSFDQLAKLDAVRDKRVGISGLGPAGLIAVQMARAYGARQVIGIDLMAERRELAKQLGAEVTLPPNDREFPAGRVGSHALDAAIDCTGLKVSINFLLARTKTVITIFGVLREEVGFGWDHWYGGFTLMGYGAHNRGAAERALRLITTGQLRLSPLVTHTLPLSKYAEGVALLRSKQAIKVCFKP